MIIKMITITINKGDNYKMFDVTEIGKKIKTARNEKNMTQMDLADAMGISYQAVSNWERGNSMPDISKIPELCQILDISMDDLMGNETSTDTVKKIISDDNADISLEELAEVAAIVPPMKMEQVFEEKKDNPDKIDIKAIIGLAPFLDDEYLEQLADKIVMKNISQLAELAPFLEDKTLTKIALNFDGPIDSLTELAPFLEDETLTQLALNYEGDVEDLLELAPFLESAALDKLVEKQLAAGNCDVDDLIDLCPFLDSLTVRKIADYLMKNKRYDALSSVAVFM